jgi:EAL and modified HD-GYP domain-containing signal transduction protein
VQAGSQAIRQGDSMTAQTVGTSAFVARQAIFNREKEVFAYELLSRAGTQNKYEATDGDASTLDVIANGFLMFGLDELTDGKRGFINFTRKLLLEDVAALLPSTMVAVEILESIEPDPEVLAACRRLKASGYMLALDDFVMSATGSPFLDVADIVKVDFMGTSPQERQRIARDLAARGVKTLAEKVETVEHFEEASGCGYEYFQGYFFAKPVVRSTSQILGSKVSYVRMLSEVNQPELSYDHLESVIKQDISFTYHLLRYINSAWFGLRYKITSIKHALVLLGPKEIRKWFALVAMRYLGTDKPSELLQCCLARAKMGEQIAPLVGLDSRAPEVFLVGMFSVIDALLDTPMEVIMAKLPLDDQVKGALLGQPNVYKTIFDAILSYEKGNWEDFSRHASELRLDEQSVPEIYAESLRWTKKALAIA